MPAPSRHRGAARYGRRAAMAPEWAVSGRNRPDFVRWLFDRIVVHVKRQWKSESALKFPGGCALYFDAARQDGPRTADFGHSDFWLATVGIGSYRNV